MIISSFYVINIFMFIFMSIFQVFYLSNFFKLGFLNPITITFFVYSPVTFATVFGGPLFLLEKGLFDKWFNFALLMTNVYLFFGIAVMVIILNISQNSFFINNRLINIFKPYNIRKNRMLFVSVLFLLLFTLSYVLLTMDYGLLNWIKEPRTGYQYHRQGNGHWYALSILFLSISYSIMLIYSKKIINTMFILLFFVYLSFLLGSKQIILSFIIFFVIILWFRKSKYFQIIMLIVPPLGFAVMLLNFGSFNIEAVLKYFDSYVNGAMYYKAYYYDEINLFYGKIWLTNFYVYLPRGIFPEKPFVYGFLHVNEHFFPGVAAETHTPAFGGVTSDFADFGIVGVIIFSIFNLNRILETVILYVLYSNSNFYNIKYNSNFFYLFIWMLAPSFMMFFGSLYSLILFVILMKTISVINNIKA
jgi:hypothetical protein